MTDIEFWAKAHRETRRMFKIYNIRYYGVADIGMENYANLLCHAFSWMFNKKAVPK